MKTKFGLFIAITATVGLCLSVAQAQKSGYGTQKGATSTSKTTSGSTTDSNAPKPGTSLGGGKYVAIPVTAEEAAKKYPLPAGKTSYPNGMDAQVANDIGSAEHSGFVKSPYSSRVYDCRKIAQGTLLLDDAVKKVFVRPR